MRVFWVLGGGSPPPLDNYAFFLHLHQLLLVDGGVVLHLVKGQMGSKDGNVIILKRKIQERSYAPETRNLTHIFFFFTKVNNILPDDFGKVPFHILVEDEQDVVGRLVQLPVLPGVPEERRVVARDVVEEGVDEDVHGAVESLQDSPVVVVGHADVAGVAHNVDDLKEGRDREK